MDFAYEALGDEKFQKFCQTLLIDLFPNVQCLPVGQPDGGRDAISRHEGGVLVFQVKYSRNPSAKDERDAISSLINSEKPKIETLIKRGATTYYLMTNVAGTSHLGTGSIDKVNDELSEAFGIPCFVWWRDDLDRRLESSKNILWRYPELARGQDFLEFLANERAELSFAQRARTFSAYMVTQHTKEADVKFQQVQIQNNLLDLFTDTPIGQAREKMPTRNSLAMSEVEHQALQAQLQRRQHAYYEPGDENMLAASWLLSAAPKSGLQRLVLEGAPGQGKSTVTQYLCQVHRAIALRKESDKERISPKHRDYTLRLPMRVDLRDYALWLTGKDPLASEKGTLRPSGSDDSLESLIAYQIHKLSGGKVFNLDDLTSVLNDSNCLLVLDGFDEVADTATRTRLIEQIRFASDRMAMVCSSLQVIVTSCPAAFILSPGFPEREWAHLSLLPMQREQIVEYTDKWISAREVGLNEGRDFKNLLLDRINRPHIRSLAQNPMQLAILLNLISTKGMSLPDKRTALYDSYMDLFFGREAEKDATVRENRDILLQIHQYVAWILQLDAEIPGGTGSISQTDLQKLVAKFLAEKEHKGDVLKLFTGAVERVGALVSRVQGLLEFEVQPLREYFAGKFLYETAPYSPPGSERCGTKPERFAALARRPYWSNVIRFYAGCYSPGELHSLIAGLEELGEDGEISLKIHALQLAILFLGDYVFAQEPKTVRKVIEFSTAGYNLRYLLAYRSSWEDGRLSLADKCGRTEVARRVLQEIGLAPEHEFLSRLGAVLRSNSSLEDRWIYWRELRVDRGEKLVIAKAIGLFADAGMQHASELIEEFGEEGADLLIQAGRWDMLSLEDKIGGLGYMLCNPAVPHPLRHDLGRPIEEDIDLFRVYILMNPHTYSFLSYNRTLELPFAEIFPRFGFVLNGLLDEDTSRLDEKNLNDIIHACYRVVQFPVTSWTSGLTAWSDLIESARRTWGDLPRLITLAGIAAGIKSKEVRAAGFSDLLDHSLPLAERARHARLRSSVGWWDTHLKQASKTIDRFIVLVLLLAWAPGAVIRGMVAAIELALEGLLEKEWSSLFLSVRAITAATTDSRVPISGLGESDLEIMRSSRLRLILLLRLPRSLSRKLFNSFLEGGRIADATSLRYVTDRVISEASKDSKVWPAVLSFYRQNPPAMDSQRVNRFGEDGMYYGHRDRMPLAVAKQVVDEPVSFPMRMLELAENSYSSKPSDEILTLGEVSRSEEWFI